MVRSLLPVRWVARKDPRSHLINATHAAPNALGTQRRFLISAQFAFGPRGCPAFSNVRAPGPSWRSDCEVQRETEACWHAPEVASRRISTDSSVDTLGFARVRGGISRPRMFERDRASSRPPRSVPAQGLIWIDLSSTISTPGLLAAGRGG